MTDPDWQKITDKLPRIDKATRVVSCKQPISDTPVVQLSTVSQVALRTQQEQQEALVSPDVSRSNQVTGSVTTEPFVVAEAIAGTKTAAGDPPARKRPRWVELVGHCTVTVQAAIAKRLARIGPVRKPPRWVGLAGRCAVTLGLLAFLLKSISWSQIWSTLLSLDPTIALVGLAVGLYTLTVSAYQWQCLLRGEQIHIDLTRLANLYLVGIAFNHFLPTSMGGDVVKVYYAGREGKNMPGSASAAIMARITGFFGMLLLAYPALLIWKTSISPAVIALFLSLSGLVLLMVSATFCLALLFRHLTHMRWLISLISVLLPDSLREKLVLSKILSKGIDIGNTLVASAKKPSPMIGSILFGVLFHFVACLNYFSFGMALHISVPLHFYLVAIPLVSLVAFLPISINGFGLREGALVFVFSTAHVPAATALLLAFAMDMQMLFFGLVGICIYGVMGRQQHKESKQGLSKKQSEVREKDRFHMDLLPLDMRSKSRSEEEEAMRNHSDENAAYPHDENIPRIKTVPLDGAALNGTVDLVVQETQTNSLMPVPVTSKRGKFKYLPLVMILSIIVVLAVLAGGFFLLKSPHSVVAYRTHLQDVNLSIGSSGIVYAGQELHVSFPLNEQVTKVYVKPGDQVAANQPLIQIDLSQLHAQVAQAADDVAAARGYLNSAIGTPQASAAQLAYDQAVSRYNALQAQVASPTLHNGTLVAPFSGTVVAVTVQNGDLVKANASLVTLKSDVSVVAHVQVPLASLAHVFANQDVLVTPSAIPNLTVHGTVSSIIRQSSAATDTFEVWVSIDNTDKQLLPGMSVFARLQEPLHTLVVPRLAVVNPDQGAIVFVIKNKHVSLRHVQTGGYVGDLMVIEGGLSDGDQVALTGIDTLQDGQAVDVSKVQS